MAGPQAGYHSLSLAEQSDLRDKCVDMDKAGITSLGLQTRELERQRQREAVQASATRALATLSVASSSGGGWSTQKMGKIATELVDSELSKRIHTSVTDVVGAARRETRMIAWMSNQKLKQDAMALTEWRSGPGQEVVKRFVRDIGLQQFRSSLVAQPTANNTLAVVYAPQKSLFGALASTLHTAASGHCNLGPALDAHWGAKNRPIMHEEV